MPIDNKTYIIGAIIAVVGVLGNSLLTNSDKLGFNSHQETSEEKPSVGVGSKLDKQDLNETDYRDCMDSEAVTLYGTCSGNRIPDNDTPTPLQKKVCALSKTKTFYGSDTSPITELYWRVCLRKSGLGEFDCKCVGSVNK